MKATLLTIGDELLIGQVVNTNAAWLGEQLSLLGVDLARVVTLGDEAAAIDAELDRACAASDLVLLTGGLGPTHDDLTVEAVAGFFGAPLRLDQRVLDGIVERFRKRGRPMAESNRKLALVPEGFDVLDNAVGTAPGLWHVDATRDAERIVVVLPGVPKEMQALFTEAVAPRLRARKGLRVIAHRTLLTAGIGESNLQDEVGDLSAHLDAGLRLAFLPSTSGVRLRLTATGEDRPTVEARLDRLERRLRARIDRYVYGRDDDSLEAVLGRLLVARGLTVAVAESCTGGLVLHRLTNVSGASAYVVGGVVAYANEVKRQRLGVEARALEQEGAVSETVARQMARGVRKRLGADLGISTTGVAGPSGGTPEKPVGTVWIACADAAGDVARAFRFGGDRATNKELSTTAALELARRYLLQIP